MSQISYSWLNTYLMCPWKWYCQYALRLPRPFETSAFIFGTSIHKAIEIAYCRWKEGKDVRPGEMEHEFESYWEKKANNTEIRYGTRENRTVLWDMGRELIRMWYFCQVDKQREILAVEQKVSDIPLVHSSGECIETPMTGRLDLIERDAEGRLVVVDNKTAAASWTELKLEHDLQSVFYGYAMANSEEYETENGEVLVRFDVLTKAKKAPKLLHYHKVVSQPDYDRMFFIIQQVLGAINAGAFYPNQGQWWCTNCYWREKECKNWQEITLTGRLY